MVNWNRQQVCREILERDPCFAQVIAWAGLPPARRSRPVSDRFPHLVRCISFQLLATSAATTIHARVVDTVGGAVTPESVMHAGEDQLRGAGLSRTKARAMVELAERVMSDDISVSRHSRMSDADIITDVTRVVGVGPWTTQMYLMHTLGRRDVWPVGDYGVRLGWSLLHEHDQIISEKQLRPAGDLLVGLRSDVAWYCWQAVAQHRAD